MTIIYANLSNVTSATLRYSRQGYYAATVVLGGRFETETSFFKDVSSFADNIQLQEMWTGSPDRNTKKTDGSTSDAYTKFATTPDDAVMQEYDGLGGTEPTVYGYRDLTNTTQNYDSQDGPKSGYAMVEDTTWKPSGEVSLSARIQNDEVSYVKFQAGDRGLEFDNKDKNKFFTGTLKGFFRLIAGSDVGGGFGDFESGEFVPFRVYKADRFIKRRAINSYRENPTTGSTTEDIRDDTPELIEYAQARLRSNQIADVSGSINMIGTGKFNNGDLIESIVTDNGTIEVNLAILDAPTTYEPVKRAGGVPSGDSISIELGRV